MTHNLIFLLFSSFSPPACIDGAVRLVGGATSSQGTVEICFSNLWGMVGDLNWGNADAEVVCKQLGYDSSGEL